MSARLPIVRRSLAMLAAVAALTTPAFADSLKLAAGAAFPSVEADSAGGTRVALPADHRGARFVALFAFSQKAGEASAKWGAALHDVLPADVAIYSVADLSHVPGLFRGFAVSAIRKQAASLDPPYRDHLLILTHGNSWSQIVPSGSDDDVVIIAVDAAGTVTDIERRAFSESAVAEISRSLPR